MRFIFPWVLSCLLTTSLFAQYKTIQGKWTKINGQQFISASFLKHIPKDQIDIIQSGFSTFTRIEANLPKGESYVPLHFMDCTAIYDTWDEFFDVVKLSPKQKSKKVNSLNKYGDFCLQYLIPLSSAIKPLIGTNSKLPATVLIEQISEKQSDNIRNWLVQQQSPLIQNLFSHMLGKFKLEKQLKFAILLPSSLPTNSKKKPQSTNIGTSK